MTHPTEGLDDVDPKLMSACWNASLVKKKFILFCRHLSYQQIVQSLLLP